MKVSKATIARTIIFAVAIINRFLTTSGAGFNLFVDEGLANLLADLFLSISGIVVFWYNNSFTQNAISADKYLRELRGEPEDDNTEEDLV